MNNQQSKECDDFAREVQQLNDKYGGQFTVAIYRQIEGELWGKMLGRERNIAGFRVDVVPTNAEAELIGTMRATANSEAAAT